MMKVVLWSCILAYFTCEAQFWPGLMKGKEKRQFGGPILASAYSGNYRYKYQNGQGRVQRPGSRRGPYEKVEQRDLENQNDVNRANLRSLSNDGSMNSDGVPQARSILRNLIKRYTLGTSYGAGYGGNVNSGGYPHKRYTLGTSYGAGYGRNDNSGGYPHKRYTLGTSYGAGYGGNDDDGYPH